MDLVEVLTSQIIVADGAMGTLLRSRGVSREVCLEELCASQPDLVTQVHADYVAAGVKLVRTNSFGGSAVRLAKWGLERRVGELNWLASRIAREATKGTGVMVAASVGPLGLPEPGERRERIHAIFEEQVGALLDGGAQCVIFETFTNLDELAIALEVKQSLHHCAAVANIVCDRQGRVGELTLQQAWSRLRDAGADLVGVNCVGTPTETLAALGDLTMEDGVIFPSAGLPAADGRYALSPEEFAEGTEAFLERGARLIGGCCGTTPEHLAALTARLFPTPAV